MKGAVTFFQVVDVKQKLETICTLVHRHFVRAERVLIAAATREAAVYLDQLLWSSPPESFLPHMLAEESVEAAVVITTAPLNLNRAKVLLNLCPAASSMAHDFELVYELLDGTDQKKQQLSLERQRHYESAGFTVSLKPLASSSSFAV